MLSIPDFFGGKHVFLTGGSGFIGKVLIEKLLRSCPQIGNIYVLIRNKKGKNIQDRLQDITNYALFDRLKQSNPTALNKIIPILGDTMKIGLGISEEDEQLLISKVNIIYNCAASVRFDDHLRDAILINVRSDRELAKLALKCKNLKTLVHVSTTYCNVNKSVIEEQVYPGQMNWNDAIEMAEDVNQERNLEVLCQKLIYPFPNTYTFTKGLAEALLNEMCADKIPLIIYRPSIVISAMKEPLPGWTDNLNGPFALVVAGCKGLTDIVYGKGDCCLDIVFVDNIVKGLIIAPWDKCSQKSAAHKAAVYNCCSELIWPLQYFDTFKHSFFWHIPFEGRLRLKFENLIEPRWYIYYFCTIMFNVIPAILGDTLLRAAGKKPILMKLQRRIYIGNAALGFFMTHSFEFKNQNYPALDGKLLDTDREDFAFLHLVPKTYEDIKNEVEIAIKGIKKYVLHEKVPIEQQTYSNTKKFYVAYWVLKVIRISLLLYVVFWKFDLLNVIFNRVFSYIENLKA